MNDTRPYQEILNAMEKHSLLIEGSALDVRGALKCKIVQMGIFTQFGIESTIPLYRITGDCFHICDHRFITQFGKVHNRAVSWSDSGKQPDDEWLYRIGFSTGAYIFGESYPTDTFNAFFDELKTYNPKYTDTHNHCLYFTAEHALKVHDQYKSIIQKYREMADCEIRESKIRNLKAELEQAEQSQ